MTDIKKEQSAIAKPENFEAKELNIETAVESEITEGKSPKEQKPEPEAPSPHRKPIHHRASQHVLSQLRDPLTQKVEKILEDNVGEAYNRLSPIAKEEFKLKGEQTAKKISELLKSTHIKVKKIFQLIFEWLRLLPGINRFFLEQEAKIKTDRIVSLHNRR